MRPVRDAARTSLIFLLMTPRTGVISSSDHRRDNQKIFIPIVDRLMCLIGRCDKKLWIKKKVAPVPNIFCPDRIHMVNVDPSKYFTTLNTEIASQIPSDDLVSYSFPLWRSIENLIQISLKPKGFLTDLPRDPQITVTVKKSRNRYQL